MKKKRAIFVLCFSFILTAAVYQVYSQEEKRLAFVIGNSNYISAPLRNPVNDASSMASKLEQLNFDVITVLDGTYQDMLTTLDYFAEELKHYDVGLFYYSGHGIQYQGVNYLIPVDSNIQRASDVQFVTLNADRVLASMSNAGNKINIMILDACRNNPFVTAFRSLDRGLSIVQAPVNSLIVYSTSPNEVAADGDGDNSPFTEALLENIDNPGEDVRVMLARVFQHVQQETGGKQIPWESSSLTEPFFFVPSIEGSGLLVIDPELTGIHVLIDNQPVGITPLKFQTNVGVHKVSFRDERIENFDVSLSVADGQTINVKPQLQMKPIILLPEELPKEVKIFINEEPLDINSKIVYVDPGEYVLNLKGTYIKPVTERINLDFGQQYDFNPQITYEKGILSFRQLPAYVDVFLDEEDVTEQLKNDDTNESRLLQNVIAGPHTLYFSGHFVESWNPQRYLTGLGKK